MATLSGNVSRLLSGTKGFDTNTPLTGAYATNLKAAGYSFAMRYVSRSAETDTDAKKNGNLYIGEAQNILNAGLGLMVIQHVRKGYWSPSASLGTSDGSACAANCKNIGIPSWVSVWCDLEQVQGGSENIIAYCNNWDKAVSGASYRSGLYVGSNCGLTSQQLYQNLSFSNYWKSASNVPAVEHTGYQMIQSGTITVSGVEIDPDTTQTDGNGSTPYILVLKIPFTCDTHSTVTIARGNKYTARISCTSYPNVVAGTGGIVTTKLESQSGDNYYISFTGVSVGSTGIYINGSSSAVFVCKVV